MNRCAARSCGRWTRAGESFCRRHRPNEGVAVDDGGDDEEATNGHAAFRSRLATGDYEAVIGRALRSVLQGAAAAADLEAEIGALRVTLARLLQEERDPSRLATGVARVAGVAVQAAKLRQSGEADEESLRAILVKTLAEIEAEGER